MSKIDALKSSILQYIQHMGPYDYAAYAWLIILFFVMILLAIIVARKNALLSIVITLISLLLLFVGPFILKHYLDIYLRPSITKSTEIKKLTFSNTLIVKGHITNISKKTFFTCRVDIDVIKNSNSDIKNFLYKLKPLLKKTMFIDKPIEVNATEEFDVVFNNYTYKKDVNISMNSVCY